MGGCMCPAIQDISGNQAYWIGDYPLFGGIEETD